MSKRREKLIELTKKGNQLVTLEGNLPIKVIETSLPRLVNASDGLHYKNIVFCGTLARDRPRVDLNHIDAERDERYGMEYQKVRKHIIRDITKQIPLKYNAFLIGEVAGIDSGGMDGGGLWRLRGEEDNFSKSGADLHGLIVSVNYFLIKKESKGSKNPRPVGWF